MADREQVYVDAQAGDFWRQATAGLLIGAVLNQRPDLFGAAMPAVGVMDMLRFQNFGFGTQWVGEYGSSANPEDFKVLRAYSPLHNIRKGAQYPPTLITTSDHDDRVMPGHSLKYAATLQQAQEGPAPILIRIETRAGHGAGKPTTKQIDEWADRFVFLKSALKIGPTRLDPKKRILAADARKAFSSRDARGAAQCRAQRGTLPPSIQPTFAWLARGFRASQRRLKQRGWGAR